jgi:hypothetical protein
MPSAKAVANCGASRYEGALAVTDVEDPDAVAGVLRRVAPYVTSSFLESARGSRLVQSMHMNKFGELLRWLEIY